MVEQFDVIVIGSGSGMLIASVAVEQGLKVALVESGRMGGTCINRGCVPSKMLIHPADVVATLKDSEKIGIHATINQMDFHNIMTRMHALVDGDSNMQAQGVEQTPNLTWFKETGEFISDYTMQVGTHTITAKKIYIVSGARSAIPPIKELERINYLTSDNVLQLQEPPKSIIIVGGGYIGVEYGHFFAGMGIKTTIIQRMPKLIPEEEPEVSDLLKLELEKRVEIYTNYEAVETRQEPDGVVLTTKNRVDGTIKEFKAERLMIATGRVSNADILKPEKTGVTLDQRGYIQVNEFLETSKKNIWAFGDAIGKAMFKHAANFEAGIVWHNSNHEHKVPMNYVAVPHGIFTHPQVASIGLKEAEAKAQHKILIGRALYRDTAMGAAMGEPNGFVKVIVDQETGKILGAHIIGAEAPILIQEIVNAMSSGNGTFESIVQAMHIHPALSEVVQNAFGNLQPA
ncbi:MAG: dihydrolipoyl dehydrogenase [Candidatus Bathyarchaeia archaeon]|jgi:dihydrolipoamide dehydrogenase